MLHAPLIRNFYLGDGHHPSECSRAGHGGGNGGHGGGVDGAFGHVGLCLSCELDGLFRQAYGGARAPYSPASLLLSWWAHAEDLAGYQQQDAHEFFLSLVSALQTSWVGRPAAAATAAGSGPPGALGAPSAAAAVGVEAMAALLAQRCEERRASAAPAASGPRTFSDGGRHAHGSDWPAAPHALSWDAAVVPNPFAAAAGPMAPGGDFGGAGPSEPAELSQPPPQPQPQQPPRGAGLVDLVFGGLLRSDVICTACGHTSTAFDPFLDLSLDIAPPREGLAGPAAAADAAAAAAAARRDARRAKCVRPRLPAAAARGGSGGECAHRRPPLAASPSRCPSTPFSPAGCRPACRPRRSRRRCWAPWPARPS